MGIEDHVFSDIDLELRIAYSDSIEIEYARTDIHDANYIILNKDDVVEMAKHLGVTEEDLEL